MFVRNADRKGTDYIELQICTMPENSVVKQIVDNDNIKHWLNSSIYVCQDDLSTFLSAYRAFLKGGIHNDLSRGELDIFGINYFDKVQVAQIVSDVYKNKPFEYELFMKFLEEAILSNGFYLFGF